ncbi:MAG: NADH-ubiquinone oxidoreductase-F iron-sulfur binding region domain-containing protein [Actinomycetes bacterium]
MTIFSESVPITPDGLARGQVHSLVEHRSAYPAPATDHLHRDVTAAGLRGCGGASFPVTRKWDAAIEAGGRGIVVANGAESEPASSKDSALLQLRPHLVLDGLSAVVRATHAKSGVVWLHQGSIHSRAAIDRALAERRAAGIFDPPITITEGPARYLSGESSSIIHALSGGPALPRTLPVPAAIRGVGGRPTVVHNVETLVRVACIASGRDHEGGRLLTVATPTTRTVLEAHPSDRLASLTSGLVGSRAAAVLLGGYGGMWYRWDDVAALPLSELGTKLGPGIVMTLPHDACGVTASARIIRNLAASSAKQCGPCIFGLGEITEVMDRIAAGRARRSDVARLQQIAAAVAGRGACHHPDGAIRMLGSAIEVFSHEFGAHRRSQQCLRRHDIGTSGSRAA